MMDTTTTIARRIEQAWAGGRPRHHEGAGPDYAATLRNLVQPWSDLYNAWTDAVRTKSWPAERHSDGCRCASCQPDDCHCRCCVADADLLVRARIGERRVIPIVIENHWRREREIELELSSWASRSDKLKIAGKLLAPTKFVLRPCEEKTAVIEIEATTDDRDTEGADVSECVVAYADLRIIGCDVRAQRIAVAVLPRDCDAFRVDCRCACCC